MLSDLMFRKGDAELAMNAFKQLLEQKPNHYSILHRLLELLRRAGRLGDAQRYLKLAAKSSPRAEYDAGLHYCQGLFAWFSNRPRDALKEFNLARKDGTWGVLALDHMIEIYLNPDAEALFEDAAEAKGDNAENVKAAEKLLNELSARMGIIHNHFFP